MASQQSCRELLVNLAPNLDPDPWVFTPLSTETEPSFSDKGVFALIREDEGLTAIQRAIPKTTHDDPPLFARITLQVYSDLEAVGLTAAISRALTDRGICANVVAGFHHDHVFVPFHRGEEALQCLKNLATATDSP